MSLAKLNILTSLFPFIALNIFCHSLLVCRVSAEKLADNLVGVTLYLTCCFSLNVFNSLFIFNYGHFKYNLSWCVLLWVNFVLDSLCFLDLDVFPFSG